MDARTVWRVARTLGIIAFAAAAVAILIAAVVYVTAEPARDPMACTAALQPRNGTERRRALRDLAARAWPLTRGEADAAVLERMMTARALDDLLDTAACVGGKVAAEQLRYAREQCRAREFAHAALRPEWQWRQCDV
jgi:hypothetical protein